MTKNPAAAVAPRKLTFACAQSAGTCWVTSAASPQEAAAFLKVKADAWLQREIGANAPSLKTLVKFVAPLYYSPGEDEREGMLWTHFKDQPVVVYPHLVGARSWAGIEVKANPDLNPFERIGETANHVGPWLSRVDFDAAVATGKLKPQLRHQKPKR